MMLGQGELPNRKVTTTERTIHQQQLIASLVFPKKGKLCTAEIHPMILRRALMEEKVEYLLHNRHTYR